MQGKHIKNSYGCRFIAFCLVFFVLLGSAIAAENEYQQMKISIFMKNETVEKVLNKVEQLAKVRFFYNHDALDFSKRISINAKDVELRDVVSQVLSGYKLEPVYQLNRVIVLRAPIVQQTKDVQKINGIVTDAQNGEPLMGASIVLKEQRGVGVVTDVNGRFHIEMLPGSATALIITYVGYQKEEVKLSSKASMKGLSVKLMPNTEEIEEVVVTGMAPRKASGFTGHYVTVKGDELRRINPNNLLDALQLYDPSFSVKENNTVGSNPNAMPEFRMRGDVQLGSGASASDFNIMMGDYSNRPNMPLFVLDGFETTLQRIVDLDPERVESITILKDAAGTTLYGAKASNGVIVFETKKPKSGALRLSYNGNYGVSMPDLSDYNLMNASEKLEYERAAGLFQTVDQLNYYNHKKEEILRGVDTYWLSQPLRTAVNHRHTVTLDGGDDAVRYSLDLNYGNNPGVMKGSNRENMGLNFSLQYRRKKLNVSNTISLANTEGNESPYGNFSDYARMNPYYRMKDDNGNYLKEIEIKPLGTGQGSQVITNPLYNTQFPYKNFTKNFNVLDNFSIEYYLLENLRVQGQVSFTRSVGRSEIFKSSNHTDFATEEDITKRGSYNKNTGEQIGWNANASINYNLVKGKHGLFATARWNISTSTSEGTNLYAKGFPNDNMTDFLYGFEMEERINGTEQTSRTVGIQGSLNYIYDQRYSFDLNIHGDQSSQFGSHQGMAPFWSAGLRWNMHREKWLQKTMVSNLVIYTNMGLTGSLSYSPYQARETYSFTFDNKLTPYPSGDVLGAQLMAIGNPDLGWSKTMSKTIGLEVGLWNSRLNFSASYYHNNTDEMLLETNVQPSTGFASVTRNVGAVLNEGVDLALNGLILNDYARQLQWSVGITATHNRNVIKKLSNEIKEMNRKNQEAELQAIKNASEGKISTLTSSAPPVIYEEGQSTTAIKLVPSLGIDPATGKEIFLTRDGQKTYIWDANDKRKVGDSSPKIRGAITSALSWKALTASVGFSYQLGGDIYNQTLVDKIENANIYNNVDRRAGGSDRWSETNRYAKYKGMQLYSQQTPASTRFLQKNNELVFSSISLGYRFEPKHFKFLESCKIASLFLNASIQDLGRISSVKQERGTSYPFARSFNLSLSILFN